MKSLICIPTYNEIENIEKLIHEINLQCPQSSILIVDDDSPDGTGKIVDQLIKKNPNLFVLHRKGKLGLASAYIEAFNYAIKNNYDCAISMDADFSHDPKYLKDHLHKINDYDFVIGSRYVEGGGTKNWPFYRKFISKSGNVYANLFLHTPFQDLTGGFNCFKISTLNNIELSQIKSEGYCFQIEIKFRCFQKKFQGTETPIIFEDRRVGQSKMSSKIVMEAMLTVPFLKKNI